MNFSSTSNLKKSSTSSYSKITQLTIGESQSKRPYKNGIWPQDSALVISKVKKVNSAKGNNNKSKSSQDQVEYEYYQVSDDDFEPIIIKRKPNAKTSTTALKKGRVANKEVCSTSNLDHLIEAKVTRNLTPNNSLGAVETTPFITCNESSEKKKNDLNFRTPGLFDKEGALSVNLDESLKKENITLHTIPTDFLDNEDTILNNWNSLPFLEGPFTSSAVTRKKNLRKRGALAKPTKLPLIITQTSLDVDSSTKSDYQGIIGSLGEKAITRTSDTDQKYLTENGTFVSTDTFLVNNLNKLEKSEERGPKSCDTSHQSTITGTSNETILNFKPFSPNTVQSLPISSSSELMEITKEINKEDEYLSPTKSIFRRQSTRKRAEEILQCQEPGPDLQITPFKCSPLKEVLGSKIWGAQMSVKTSISQENLFTSSPLKRDIYHQTVPLERSPIKVDTFKNLVFTNEFIFNHISPLKEVSNLENCSVRISQNLIAASSPQENSCTFLSPVKRKKNLKRRCDSSKSKPQLPDDNIFYLRAAQESPTKKLKLDYGVDNGEISSNQQLESIPLMDNHKSNVIPFNSNIDVIYIDEPPIVTMNLPQFKAENNQTKGNMVPNLSLNDSENPFYVGSPSSLLNSNPVRHGTRSPTKSIMSRQKRIQVLSQKKDVNQKKPETTANNSNEKKEAKIGTTSRTFAKSDSIKGPNKKSSSKHINDLMASVKVDTRIKGKVARAAQDVTVKEKNKGEEDSGQKLAIRSRVKELRKKHSVFILRKDDPEENDVFQSPIIIRKRQVYTGNRRKRKGLYQGKPYPKYDINTTPLLPPKEAFQLVIEEEYDQVFCLSDPPSNRDLQVDTAEFRGNPPVLKWRPSCFVCKFRQPADIYIDQHGQERTVQSMWKLPSYGGKRKIDDDVWWSPCIARVECMTNYQREARILAEEAVQEHRKRVGALKLPPEAAQVVGEVNL